MVSCSELKMPGVAAKILYQSGAAALNKAMLDCGEVAKSLRQPVTELGGDMLVLKSAGGSDYDDHLDKALFPGAARYLRQHGEAATNAELTRRGIKKTVFVQGGQQKSSPAAPAFDPVFPGMQVPADNSQPDTTGQQKAYQEKHKRAGTDPLFGSMNVPLSAFTKK